MFKVYKPFWVSLYQEYDYYYDRLFFDADFVRTDESVATPKTA